MENSEALHALTTAVNALTDVNGRGFLTDDETSPVLSKLNGLRETYAAQIATEQLQAPGVADVVAKLADDPDYLTKLAQQAAAAQAVIDQAAQQTVASSE